MRLSYLILEKMVLFVGHEYVFCDLFHTMH